MNHFQIKQVESAHFDAALNLDEYAFQYTLSDYEREKKKKELQGQQFVLGSFVNNHLAAKLHILPLKLFIGKDSIDFGGIASVATWPELRRNGHINQLIRQGFIEMKRKGQVLSMLHPFLIKFYQSFGYEVTHYTYKYKLVPKDISLQHIEGYCRRVSIETNLVELATLYHQAAQQYGLMIDRDDWWWENRVVSERDSVIIYYDGNEKPSGYLIANIKKSTLYVKEFVYHSKEACQGLLQWIKNHDSMVDDVDLHVQPNETLAFYLDNPSIPYTKEAYFMSRIVDFVGFMNRYPYITTKKRVKLLIEIEDTHASWNTGVWLVTFENGMCVTINKVDYMEESTADIVVSGNINMVSAWLLGSESLDNLRAFGKLQVEEKILAWEDISEINQPHILDSF
ncbi:GNAT family N-acetyltransferase [Amphibacillus jilinensis]|uniref:GNAT family N-acetyltransferase n=1 Tax=Amphibacillus jilinensis TaxID=1216008 RepID=UPI0002EA2C7F|nr:GNAT family N-acetyltransferase [Amphibacillus jilinensis]